MKIICVGRNYKDHAKELNNPIPKKPMLFLKPGTALLVNNKPFYYPSFSKQIHYEVEILLKIVKNGKHVQKEFAAGYYKQIGLGIDFTARDIQLELKSKGQPWEISKAFDNSAVVGAFINKELIKTIDNINFKLYKNEKIVQEGHTKDMVFDFDTLICYISKFFKLQVGDIIFTGTPAGVGPIKIGDTLVGYIEEKKSFSCEIR